MPGEILLQKAEEFVLPIFNKYYASSPEALELVLTHSRCVTRKALRCMEGRGIGLDTEFMLQAAMLHDIGVVCCDATSIYCHGSQPYIRHGISGADILRNEGLPRHALVCERHTGAGLTLEDILAGNLPLPHRDFLPQSVEERLICYADKFYSKSSTPELEKPFDRVLRSVGKFGEGSRQRFLVLHSEFSLPE